MNILFELPLWFFLLPALLVLSFIFKKRGKKQNDKHNLTSIYLPSFFGSNISLTESSRKERKLLSWFLIILMTTALAQPVKKIKKQTNPDTLRDIIFIVDTSVGMSISDYVLKSESVSRLTLLKAVLTDFIGKLPNNRIGLMVYADEAYALSPLTQDKNLISYAISQIQPAVSGRQNNISNALNSVLKQYDFKTSKPSVVLLSQGANIEGDINPIEIAKRFKSKKIKLHVIGLGSNKETDDNDNKLIFDSIDEKLLKQLSKITNGEFFWVGKSNNLHDIFRTIMESETIEIKKDTYYLFENYYYIPLYITLFIIITLLFKATLINHKK